MATVQLVTAPAEEPVSLAEAKAHLRVDGNEEDALISGLVAAARGFAEAECDRAIITQTWKMYLRSFAQDPAERMVREDQIRLYYPQLQTVTHVKYRDSDGELQTIDADDYVVDAAAEPGTIEPATGKAWPSALDHPQGVEIQYVCGYGAAAAVPELLKRAMLLLVGHLFEHRESVISGTIVGEVPQGLRLLLSSFKVPRFV